MCAYIVLAACIAGLLDMGHASVARAASVPSSTTIVAVMAPTYARRSSCSGRRIRRISTTAPFGGGIMRLRVLKVRSSIDALGNVTYCYRVIMPYRGAVPTGWIRGDKLRVSSTGWFVRVDLSDRRMYVYAKGKVRRKWPIVIGARATPTPRGRFFIQGKVRTTNALYGKHIIAFAYSRVIKQFDGGPGRVAFHGRGGALLRDPLGSARSHGCIRMANRNIRWLAKVVDNGVPVDVQR